MSNKLINCLLKKEVFPVKITFYKSCAGIKLCKQTRYSKKNKTSRELDLFYFI